MLTNENDPNGTWNSYRPLVVDLATGVANISGNAATATKLATARSLMVDLSSTAPVTFDGSAAQNNIPVKSALGIANGGHGAITAREGLLNLQGLLAVSVGAPTGSDLDTSEHMWTPGNCFRCTSKTTANKPRDTNGIVQIIGESSVYATQIYYFNTIDNATSNIIYIRSRYHEDGNVIYTSPWTRIHNTSRDASVKAWGYINGATGVIAKSFNVASTTVLSTGKIQVTYTNKASSDAHSILLTAYTTEGIKRAISFTSPLTTGFTALMTQNDVAQGFIFTFASIWEDS